LILFDDAYIIWVTYMHAGHDPCGGSALSRV